MQKKSDLINAWGFSFVELMIAMVVGMGAVGAVYSMYIVYQNQYQTQKIGVTIQQDLRGALVIMEQQIRMAGYDPEDTGRFGITDIRRYGLVDTGADPSGQPALFYTVDLDENGVEDPRNGYHNREHCNFRIRDDKATGRRSLCWDNGAGRQPVAENIQALGFAYGVDTDGDGRLDVWNNGVHPIWAVDADNDNRLDTHLDTDDNGLIDEKDDADGDLRITAGDGGAIDPPIAITCIRTVRVWLLAVSPYPLKKHMDMGTYVVGDRIVKVSGDGFLRRLAQTTIVGRNL